jgi:hypothetical protein
MSKTCDIDDTIYVTAEDIRLAIKDLTKGKTGGCDGLGAEHFQYASAKVNILLSIFVSARFIHGFLPKQFMTTVLVPVIKNKNKSVKTSTNYRPIALSNTICKIVEKILLDRIQMFVIINDNQFGFKKQHGTAYVYVCFEGNFT